MAHEVVGTYCGFLGALGAGQEQAVRSWGSAAFLAGQRRLAPGGQRHAHRWARLRVLVLEPSRQTP